MTFIFKSKESIFILKEISPIYIGIDGNKRSRISFENDGDCLLLDQSMSSEEVMGIVHSRIRKAIQNSDFEEGCAFVDISDIAV